MTFDDDDNQGDGWQPEENELAFSIPELDFWKDNELETYQQDATAALVVCLQHDPHSRGILDKDLLRRPVEQIRRHDDGALVDDVIAKIDVGTIDADELTRELSQIPFSETE